MAAVEEVALGELEHKVCIASGDFSWVSGSKLLPLGNL